MSDDPASKDGLRWEIRRSLIERLRLPWDGMGDMANQQRAEAAVQITTMMDEIEAWKKAMQNADRDSDELRGMLEVANEMAEHYAQERDTERAEADRLARRNALLVAEIETVREERDEARRQVCERDAAERTKSAWSNGLSMRYISQDIARERGWDCFKEKP